LTGAYRSAHAEQPDADRRVADGVDTGDRRPCSLDLTVAHPDDRHPRSVVHLEVDDPEVGVGAARIAEEVLGGVPALALEVAGAEVAVGPRFDPDREIAPARTEMFRQVFHAYSSAVDASLSSARSATSTPT